MKCTNPLEQGKEATVLLIEALTLISRLSLQDGSYPKTVERMRGIARAALADFKLLRADEG